MPVNEQMINEQMISDEEYERRYRKDTTRHSFLGALYSAVGGAAFFSVLGGLINMAISGIAEAAPGTATLSSALTSAGMAVSPAVVTASVMIAVTIIGAVSTYMAQEEFTEVKCLQDERLARKNAQCMGEQRELTTPKSCAAEYEHNQRADNKKWQDVVKTHSDLMKQPSVAIH